MATKTPELLAEIEKVIANDATITCVYQGDRPGEMCVLGGLADHAGIALPSTIAEAPFDSPDNQKGIMHVALTGFATKLEERYALRRSELSELQRVNDGVSNDIAYRRARLCSKLNEIWNRK